ncbi:toxin-antitoxin system YwqK family antitoxin [Pseudomonas sp. MBLB4136]|uniref:toxin-antitoxin system YwqK family antitoxin n=1 Tax=Pseudomonas sp. MBLB4136 TaxID=3451558 RepID=UPI003F74B620
MSFFKNAKTLISASARAAGRSVELMADLAVRLEHETNILALRAAVNNLELLEKNPKVDLEGRGRVQLRKELFEKYDELITLLGPQERLDFEARKEALMRSERLEKVHALNSRIAEMELRVKKGGYSLPVQEQRALQNLVDSYEQLFKFDSCNRTAELVKRNRQLKLDIEALEVRRRRIKEDFFPSGIKKSLIRFLDEKKEGISECWYETGVLKAQVDFKAGLAHGKCVFWYESGALELDAICRGGHIVFPSTGYSSNGVRVIELLGDCVRVRMWNGVYLGCYRLGSSVLFAKFRMFFRLLFSFKTVREFYRAKKGGPEKDFFNEFMGVMRKLTVDVGDVFM